MSRQTRPDPARLARAMGEPDPTPPLHRTVAVYRGPSALTGAPVVVLAIPRSPAKLDVDGATVQIAILPDVELGPVGSEAPLRPWQRAIGRVCPSSCVHVTADAGAPTCYAWGGHVVIAHASSWRAWERDGSPVLAPNQIASWVAGRRVRLGSLGDPAALPAWLVAALLECSAGWTGYTHAWRSRPDLAAVLMASVDSVPEARDAWRQGWRTYRAESGSEGRTAGEIVCPAYTRDRACSECMLCDGAGTSGARSIVAPRHETPKARRTALRVLS